MGLVMGTFSMQSKPVSYHKGKRFFFCCFVISKFFPSTRPGSAFAFFWICEPAVLHARGPAMMHVCASVLESCMFALRVMNIAQEMHLRGWADCQVRAM